MLDILKRDVEYTKIVGACRLMARILSERKNKN